MVSYVKGIDVALWEPVIDWAKVRAQDIRFVFIKASQKDFTDPLFDSHWAGAKQAGILRGAYHFLDPSVSGTLQANTFLAKVKLEPGDLPPVLDLEELKTNTAQGSTGSKGSKPGRGKDGKGAKGGKSGMIPNAQIVSCAEAWLTKVEAETGRKPIIYSGPFFLRDRVSRPNGKPPPWATKYVIWLANYLNHEIGENDLPFQPPGWSPWTFWQYNDKGVLDGITDKEGKRPTGVDLNFYRGTLEELDALAGASHPPQPQPDPEPPHPQPDPVPPPPPPVPPPEKPTIKYVVRAGDVLGKLAEKFHTTQEAIMALNPQIKEPHRWLIKDNKLTVPDGWS